MPVELLVKWNISDLKYLSIFNLEYLILAREQVVNVFLFVFVLI